MIMRFMQLTSLKKCNYNNKALSLSIHKEARYRHLFQVSVSLNWLHSTGFILVYTTASHRREKPFVCFHVVTNWPVMLPMVIFCWRHPGPFWCAVWWACLCYNPTPAPQGVHRHTTCPFQDRRRSRAMAPCFVSDELGSVFRAVSWSLSSSRAPGTLLCGGELSLGLGGLEKIMPLFFVWRVKVEAFAPQAESITEQQSSKHFSLV